MRTNYGEHFPDVANGAVTDGDVVLTTLKEKDDSDTVVSKEQANDKWKMPADKPGDATQDEEVTPDDVIRQLGGCGTFQILLVIIIHAMKTTVCWSMTGMVFFAYTPRWRCIDTDANHTSILYNMSKWDTNATLVTKNGTEYIWDQRCETASGKACSAYEFEPGIRTLVTEYNLVCDLSWGAATIASLQMLGMIVGSVISGQIADTFGRKVPLFTSMVILIVFHLICYFSKSWVLYGVSRVFIGIGCAFYLTSCYTVCVEYTLSRWRSIIIALPTWALQSSLFALVAWLTGDWKTVTIIMIIITAACLLAWFYVPESFRWLITQNKYEQAETVVNRISRINRHPEPDFQRMRESISKQEVEEHTKKYSVLVLFRRLSLLKITLPLSMMWFSMGFIGYGINFAIQKLSGDFYMNFFLFSIASTPSKLISMYLQNRFGRRIAGRVAFTVCFLGGLAVAIVQYIDTPYKGVITNYCALAANIGQDGTWGPSQTHTLELYPTVIRNTGFGFVSILARVGAMVAPQFVYLSELVPGLLFFLVAACSALSTLATVLLPETNNTTMVDRLGAKYTRKKEVY